MAVELNLLEQNNACEENDGEKKTENRNEAEKHYTKGFELWAQGTGHTECLKHRT